MLAEQWLTTVVLAEQWWKLVLLLGATTVTVLGVSLHKFLNYEVLRKKRIDQVKRHRDKSEPTEYSVLCSLHFEQSCFRADTILTQWLGLGKKKATLKPIAVPTLFTKQVTSNIIQRPRQERRNLHLCTPGTNLETRLSGKLLKNVLVVICHCCVYVMFMTIGTMT